MKQMDWLVRSLAVWFCLGLGACTTPNPEYEGSCEPGTRRCGGSAAQPVAMVCGRDAEDRIVQIEQPCPPGTQCDAGRCTPAPGTKACQRQGECAGGSVCTPLVNQGAIATYCVAPKSGGKAPGEVCTKDSDCQSYYCLQQANDRRCFQACQTNSDCTRSCGQLNVTVTGVQGMLSACNQ